MKLQSQRNGLSEKSTTFRFFHTFNGRDSNEIVESLPEDTSSSRSESSTPFRSDPSKVDIGLLLSRSFVNFEWLAKNTREKEAIPVPDKSSSTRSLRP